MIERMSALMMGDQDDQRAASLLAQGEAFAKAALSSIAELADSGYEDEANSLMAWISDALSEL